MVEMASIDPFSKFARALRKSKSHMTGRVVPHAIDILAHRILKRAKINLTTNKSVITGALRASGRVEPGQRDNQRIVAFGGEGTGVEYAKAVEYGRYSYAPFVPKPYLRPAIIQ